MDSAFTKSLLALALAAALTACGGSSSGASAPSDDNNDSTQQPGPGTPPDETDPTDPNEGQEPEPQPEPDPEEPVDEPEPVDPQVLTLLDTNNNVTVSFCPQLVADVPFGGAIDSLACENEALTNLSIDNNSSLGLICPQTVAQVPGSFADTLPDPEFLPACLMEGAESIQANLTGLFDGTSPLLAEACRDSDDFAGCFIDTMTSLPETFAGFAAVLGCEDFEDPQACLVGAGEKFASGELLIGGANILTQAVCPLANNQAEFDPQACGQEIFAGLGSIVGTSGGLEELCGPDADPFTCFLEAGDNFGAITDLFSDTPLDPSLVTGLLEGLADPANGDALEALPMLLSEIPVLGDILLEAFEQFPGGGDGGSPLDQLQGLDDLAGALESIPVLGDIINGLLEGGMPGGDGGFGPDALLDLLDPSQLGEGAEILEDIPVLGDIIAQLAGALDGDMTNPLDFLTEAGSNLEALTDVLGQIPVLGDVLNTVIGALLGGGLPEGGFPGAPGGGDGDPLAPLTDALDQIPVLGELLNEAISTLAGFADGGFPGGDGGLPFDGAPEQLEQIPVLGELINTLLSGDPSELFDMGGNPLEPLTSLLEPLTGLLDSIPVLGDIIGGLLGTFAP